MQNVQERTLDLIERIVTHRGDYECYAAYNASNVLNLHVVHKNTMKDVLVLRLNFQPGTLRIETNNLHVKDALKGLPAYIPHSELERVLDIIRDWRG